MRDPRGAPPGGGPTSSAGARGAMLLAVAVILGIVLLQQFDSDIPTGQVSADGTVDAAESTTTTRRPTLTSVANTTTPGAAVRPKGEVKVVVANGSGVRGLGARTTDALKGVGYATLPPVDATGDVPRTSVMYAEGYQAEAREVATTISQPATIAVPLAAPPVATADLGDAKVVVILGLDLAASTTTTAGTGASSTTSTTRRL